MRQLTISQGSYIAGILDGEGCIGVYKRKSKSSTHEYDFGVRVIITNSNLDLIKWIKEVTGVGCAWVDKKPDVERWNLIHRYQITGTEAKNLIEQIYPYLIVKKTKADVALSFPTYKKGKRRTIGEYRHQEGLFESLLVMNKRGRVVLID